MLVVALVGVAVNLVATVVLHGADRTSLNVEGAFQHVLTDLVAFIATAIAGAVILLTGFDRADGIASLFVAAVMLRAAWALLRDSGRIFLEAAPQRHRRRRGRRRRWSPSTASTRSTTCTSGRSPRASRRCRRTCSWAPTTTATGRAMDLEAVLHDRFGIEHTTLQVDHEGGDLLEIEIRDGASAPPPPAVS